MTKKLEGIKKTAYKWASEYNLDKDLFLYWGEEKVDFDEFKYFARKMCSKKLLVSRKLL